MIKSIAILPVSEMGKELASRISLAYPEAVIYNYSDAEKAFRESQALIYIGALGICVRSIAPFVKDKHSDPAVVCIDSTGKHVISVLSGHIGGANRLTEELARLLQAGPVITTQSDNMGLWALDTLSHTYNWTMKLRLKDHEEDVDGEKSDALLNRAIALFVNKKQVALLLEQEDEGSRFLEKTCPSHVHIYKGITEIPTNQYELIIAVSPYKHVYPALCLQFIPRVLHIGMGCKRNLEVEDAFLVNYLYRILQEKHLYPEAIADVNSVDIKAEEKALLRLSKTLQVPFHTYPAEMLDEWAVPNPSEIVRSATGTKSVSEASALCAARGGELIIPKQIYHEGELQFTLAVALGENAGHGHIEIVGAGPGDPELVSVRGKHFLQHAELILYAGSLVPKELTCYAKPEAMVRSSADMNLEEQFQLMKSFYDRGKLVVRLHTGDPCLYGAIQEQMNYFDRYRMSYHITPGISAFQAAAAELRSEFTVPEKVQTIILTRGEGRTPVPEKEQLHKLAESQSTMCIYLSATIADKVQSELLQHYAPETPVAVCYKLTWKDQRIFRGELKDLARIVKENNLTLTTLLVVGEAIGHREGLSRLYADEFKHLFRR